MKVVAHPLVVAVALGLVAPDTLEVAEPEPKVAPCEGCPGELSTSSAWEPTEAPSAEEFHRVELEWLAATKQA